ncbi:M23 family metallopeptidase [Bartonella sp. CB169]|uniref:M23 family metallopeptidase n=1 Tax=Bartonella sp. CB169 TaxID=3112257 RepID=UPI00300DC4AC
MCLKVLDNVFRHNFWRIACLAVVTVFFGCSSGTQRFTHNFSSHTVSTRSNMSTTPVNPQMLSYSGIIQSTELPPVESSADSLSDGNIPHNYSRQDATSSPERQVMGALPRNLGTLSRSQMDHFPVFQKNSYIVQNGDTLLSIARQVGVSVESLKLANGISSNSIYIGQVLMIPSKHTLAASNIHKDDWRGSTTKPSFQAQSMSSIGYKRAQPYKNRTSIVTVPSAEINGENTNIEKNSSGQITQLSHETSFSDAIKNKDNVFTPQATGIAKMRWPVRGRLLSQFGQKKGTTINRGIDISVPEGSSVKAAENGVVIYAGDGLKELGNVVMIRHENNIVTVYGSNSKLVVNKGQRIRRGDEIAKSGVSGNIKIPRVYFGVYKDLLPVDPIKYLEN